MAAQDFKRVTARLEQAKREMLWAIDALEDADTLREEYIPNGWYDALPGKSYKIVEYPLILVHLHRMSRRELATREIMLTIPPYIKGTPPPWRVKGCRAWTELTLEWDKMLKDMRMLFVSAVKLVTKR